MDYEKLVESSRMVGEVKANFVSVLNSQSMNASDLKGLFSSWRMEEGNLVFTLFGIPCILYLASRSVGGCALEFKGTLVANTDGRVIPVSEFSINNRFEVSDFVFKANDIESIMKYLISVVFNII